MKTSLCPAVAAALLATAMIGTVSAATLYVSLDSTNPIPPFASWETAATNIQNAVDAAKAADTVLVTNGVYQVGGRDVSVFDEGWGQWFSRGLSRVVITNASRLESVNGPLTTTIVGGTATNEAGEVVGFRCVYLGTNGVLSGFALTNGNAGSGGGVWCASTNAALTNCVMVGNSADYAGGGAYSGTLYNCTLTGNSAEYGGGANGGTLYNCVLTGNEGMQRGLNMPGHGGGALESTLYNCTLTDNSAAWGGGAYASTLYNCTLTDNSAYYAGGGAYSGTLYNCTLSGNSAGMFALGLGGGASGSTLYNCTLTSNSALEGGGAFEGTLYNCVVYYNTAPNGANYFTGMTDWGGEISTLLHHSCTTPLPTNGIGNITGPPLFMDMEGGDFRLREDSPCIDAGTNLLSVVGYSYEPTDILGNTRFIDGNGDGKVAWDIGAYEFNSFKPPRFNIAPQLTPNGWQLNITGAANKVARLQRSGNLKDWEEIWSGLMGAEEVQQVNDGDTGPKAMFYRVVVP